MLSFDADCGSCVAEAEVGCGDDAALISVMEHSMPQAPTATASAAAAERMLRMLMMMSSAPSSS